MKIVFVRHGQSAANIEQIAAGSRLDSPLTETGKEQARTAGNLLKERGYVFDVVVSSSLYRAKETARIITDQLGLEHEIITMDSLKERDLGVYTGIPLTELHAILELKNPDTSLETKPDFYNRIQTAVNEIRHMNARCVLVVGHTGMSRPFRAIMEGRGVEAIDDYQHIENAEILTYDI